MFNILIKSAIYFFEISSCV